MTRSALPQTSGATLLTDSGIETEIIYGQGRDLPGFAVFPLLADDDGRAMLEQYYREHVAIAADHHLGYVLETPSYRSGADWGRPLGLHPGRARRSGPGGRVVPSVDPGHES